MKKTEDDDIKITWDRTINIEERVIMERVRVTKENFFTRFKPSSKAEVLLENGLTVNITSKPVLEMIRKGKLLMEQNDVDGFRKLMLGTEYLALSDEDARLLHHTNMIEDTKYGYTIFELISDICDLNN